jgi:hypothetical protein
MVLKRWRCWQKFGFDAMIEELEKLPLQNDRPRAKSA